MLINRDCVLLNIIHNTICTSIGHEFMVWIGLVTLIV